MTRVSGVLRVSAAVFQPHRQAWKGLSGDRAAVGALAHPALLAPTPPSRTRIPSLRNHQNLPTVARGSSQEPLHLSGQAVSSHVPCSDPQFERFTGKSPSHGKGVCIKEVPSSFPASLGTVGRLFLTRLPFPEVAVLSWPESHFSACLCMLLCGRDEGTVRPCPRLHSPPAGGRASASQQATGTPTTLDRKDDVLTVTLPAEPAWPSSLA